MDIRLAPKRKPLLYIHFLYSLAMHTFVFSLLVALPIYNGGRGKESFGWYLVSLENDEEYAERLSTQVTMESEVRKASNAHIEHSRTFKGSDEKTTEEVAEDMRLPRREVEKMSEPGNIWFEKAVKNVLPGRNTKSVEVPAAAVVSKVSVPPVHHTMDASSLLLPAKDDNRGSGKKEDRDGDDGASVQKVTVKKTIHAEKTDTAPFKVSEMTHIVADGAKEVSVQAAASASERQHEKAEAILQTKALASKMFETGETALLASQEREEDNGFSMETYYEKCPSAEKESSRSHPPSVEVTKASPKATEASSKIEHSIKKKRRIGKTNASAIRDPSVKKAVHAGKHRSPSGDKSIQGQSENDGNPESHKTAGKLSDVLEASWGIPHRARNTGDTETMTLEGRFSGNISSELPSIQKALSVIESRSDAVHVSNKITTKADISTIKTAPEEISQTTLATDESESGEKQSSTIDNGIDDTRKATGIPLSEAFFRKDIQIEALLKGAELPDVFMRLMRKAYLNSNDHRKNIKEQLNEVETINETEERKNAEGQKVKRMFSVVSAEKGIYTFVVENKGERTYEAEFIFHLYKGTKRERSKEYRAIQLHPGRAIRFRFILPDAVFWDEEERFSGRIEDSHSITKFNYDAGLYWREDKE